MGGNELVVRNITELIDPFKLRPPHAHVQLVVLQNRLLVLLQRPDSLHLLLGIVYLWEVEEFQELVLCKVEELAEVFLVCGWLYDALLPQYNNHQ